MSTGSACREIARPSVAIFLPNAPCNRNLRRPRFRAVLVAAFAAVVRVLHFHQIKIFFPMRPLLQKRGGAIAHLHPAHRLVRGHPRFIHVPQIFTFGNRALPQRAAFDRLPQALPPAVFHSRSDQISHLGKLSVLNAQPLAFGCRSNFTVFSIHPALADIQIDAVALHQSVRQYIEPC